MKGTPEMPQCGFSRASIEILGVQGVDPAKFSAFNVLEDEELRQGEFNIGWAAASVGGWVGRDGVLTCAQE
jgi:glutaredoxin-related protein